MKGRLVEEDVATTALKMRDGIPERLKPGWLDIMKIGRNWAVQCTEHIGVNGGLEECKVACFQMGSLPAAKHETQA